MINDWHARSTGIINQRIYASNHKDIDTKAFGRDSIVRQMSCFFLTSTFSFMQTQNPTNSTNYFLSCKFHIYILNKTFCVPFNLLVPLAFSCCRALLLPAEGGQQQRIQRLHFPIITKHWSAADLQICFCSRPVHYKGLERSLWLPVIKSWCSVTCSFAWDGSNISDEAADSLHGLLLSDYSKYWVTSYDWRGFGNSFYLCSPHLH